MDATSPARARRPTDVAARRYGFIRSGRPPLGCCWTLGVGMDRSAGSTSLLRLRAVRRSLPGACDVFAAPRPMDDRAGGVGRSATLGRVTRPGRPSRGWFITLEGPEGAGKTTQTTALAEHLEGRGLDVHVTREPGGTWLGERLREVLLARTDPAAPTDPLTDALLFNAARRQLVTEVIRPALDGGHDRRLRPLRRLDARLPGLRRRRPARRRCARSRRSRPTASART